MMKNENQIDDYQIIMEDVVGKGRYGNVYGCKSTKEPLLSLCAKVRNTICQIMMVSDTTKLYAEREKSISDIISKNQLNQNLVKIYLVKELPEKKKLIIIMEKCESNLQKYMEEKNPKAFSDIELFDFLVQFLNGYSILYNNNIIHRDIKPENILIKKDKQKIIYQISDFGIAKTYKANDFKLTKIGTPAYVAPEINSQHPNNQAYQILVTLKKFQHSKSQVDIYSLGIILYQMVYASFPFEKQVQSILDFTQKIKISPLKLTGTSNFKEIIEKMLIYYPDQRMSFEQLYKFVSEKQATICTFPNQIKFGNKVDIPFQGFKKYVQYIPADQLNPNQNQLNPDQNQLNPNQNQLNPKPNQRFPYQNQINPNPIQIVQAQNQLPQLIRQTIISPHQKIKEYIQFILNDQGDIIKDQIKMNLQFYIQNSTFSFEQLRELVRLFKKQIQNPEKCQSQTLFFFYCILSLLNGSEVQNLQFLQDKTIAEIQRLYKILVDRGSLTR